MGIAKSPPAASAARTGDRGKPAKSDCQGGTGSRLQGTAVTAKAVSACRRAFDGTPRVSGAKGKTSKAYGASSARVRAKPRTTQRAARMRHEDGVGGRRAGCMGDSESERLCRHRRSHRPFRDRSALPCVIASFPVAPACAECVEGDHEWTNGPGIQSCRGPCGARILHAPFLCMHAAMQQCGGVGCVFTSPSLHERKGAEAMPFSSFLCAQRAGRKNKCRSSPPLRAQGAKRSAALFLPLARAQGGGRGAFDVAVFALRLWLRHQPHPGTAPYTRHTKARCPAPAQGGDEA
jgi:hypothetical protein